MYVPTQEEILSKLNDALGTLKQLNVSFQGPFTTPGKKRVYFIDGCILTESEIVVLHEGGHFRPGNIEMLLSGLKSLQLTQPRELKTIDKANPRNRRRSQRVMLRLALLIRWESSAGKRAQTQAFTGMVNGHGGLLDSPARIPVGQRMTLVNPQTGKEVSCRIIRVERSSEGSFRTAFEFDQCSPRFWPIAFPPLDWETSSVPA